MPLAARNVRARGHNDEGKRKTGLEDLSLEDLHEQIARGKGESERSDFDDDDSKNESGTGMRKSQVHEDDFAAVLEQEGLEKEVTLTRAQQIEIWLDVVIGFAILLNALCIGLELDLRGYVDDIVWVVLENVFCIIWILETVFKLYHFRIEYFKDRWNYLDLFLVALAIWEAWLAPVLAAGVTDLGALRLVRMLRLLRLVKLLKVMKLSRNLWLLVSGCMESISTLSWVCLLILLVIYSFAIFMRTTVDCAEGYAQWDACKQMFGSVIGTMYTLFQIVTLESWSMAVTRPLMQVHPEFFIVIMMFLLLTTFGLLNIIVGVIVENTLSVAKQNMDLQKKRAERQLFKELEILKTLFEEADADGSGTLDKQEFCEIIDVEAVKNTFVRMDVPVEQPSAIFDLIDAERHGEVPFTAFTAGIQKIRGPPSNLDFKVMAVTVQSIVKRQNALEADVKQVNAILRKALEEMDEDDAESAAPEDDEEHIAGETMEEEEAPEEVEAANLPSRPVSPSAFSARSEHTHLESACSPRLDVAEMPENSIEEPKPLLFDHHPFAATEPEQPSPVVSAYRQQPDRVAFLPGRSSTDSQPHPPRPPKDEEVLLPSGAADDLALRSLARSLPYGPIVQGERLPIDGKLALSRPVTGITVVGERLGREKMPERFPMSVKPRAKSTNLNKMDTF